MFLCKLNCHLTSKTIWINCLIHRKNLVFSISTAENGLFTEKQNTQLASSPPDLSSVSQSNLLGSLMLEGLIQFENLQCVSAALLLITHIIPHLPTEDLPMHNPFKKKNPMQHTSHLPQGSIQEPLPQSAQLLRLCRDSLEFVEVSNPDCDSCPQWLNQLSTLLQVRAEDVI